MTVVTIAIVSAAAVVIVLVAVTLSLTRQVRRLGTQVQSLSHATPAGAPIVPHAREDDATVLTPVPMGRTELEPDLRAARVASVALAGPLVKLAAFSHGVRRALDEETRIRAAHAFRKELRRQRRLRRRQAAAAGPPHKEGWRP